MALPLILHVDGLVDYFAETGPPTASDLKSALHQVDRNRGPDLLYDLLFDGLLTAEVAAATVGQVWSSAEYPDAALLRAQWRALFHVSGYTVDGVPAPRPDAPLFLYRGSVSERRADWSWTDELSVATGYANGTAARRPVGLVWQAHVEPWRLFARNVAGGREESEYVIDTDDLLIVEHTKP